MACFTVIEINGDHTSDLETKDHLEVQFGDVLRECIANPLNAPRLLDEHDLYRAVRLICQNGSPIMSTSAQYHLWLNPSVVRDKQAPALDRHATEVEAQLWTVLADLEALNMRLSSSELQSCCHKIRTVATLFQMKRKTKEGML